MTGVTDSNTAFAVLSGRGVISKRRAIESLAGRINHGAHVMGRRGSRLPRCDGDAGRRVRAGGREVASHQPDQHAPLKPRRLPRRIQGHIHEASAILSDVVPVATLVP